MAEPEGDEDVIDWDLALDEVVRDGTLAPHGVGPVCVSFCLPRLTTAVALAVSRSAGCRCGQGDGEWEFVLDMVSELFLAVLQHVKSALQGTVEYRKRGADMTWDEFLATANVRGRGLLPPGAFALNSHVAAGCVHPRRRSTSQHTRSRARRARCTARLWAQRPSTWSMLSVARVISPVSRAWPSLTRVRMWAFGPACFTPHEH